MATRDDTKPPSGAGTTLPVVPAIVRPSSDTGLPEDPTPAATQAPEALGFNLRFEAGRALLALENKVVSPGVEVKRALFEVPDVAFPLDVSGGAQRFQQKRLTLRAIELSLSHASLFVPDKLRAAGFTLIRERSRAGALELLVEVQGPSGPVPVRARGVIVPVGEAGAALVLHELIAFGPLPRPRIELCASLLDALALPGALPSRAMLKRSEPFRAVLSRLLPLYGWKVPALGDTRVHEAVLGKGEITLRAWARELPEGWKAPKDSKRGPVEEAVALAVFADGLVDVLAAGGDSAARVAVVDRLVDDGALPPSVVPFAAEVLQSDPRRRAEAHDLIARGVADHPEHTGLLAAHAEQEGIAPLERAARLAALGRAADAGDEPWVAARAFLAAAIAARDADDVAAATKNAEAAYLADPSLPETGLMFSELLAQAGDAARAVSVGRTALERAETPEQAEVFAVRLAQLAKGVEGLDAARVLLRRALRRADRMDALVALVEVEVEAGALERAAELLTRLLVVAEGQGPDARAEIEQLAAHIAEARGEREAAKMHLQKALALRPADGRIAVRLATLLDDGRAPERPLEVLKAALDDPDAPKAPLLLAARLVLRRRADGDAERARAWLARIKQSERTADVMRLDAEAEAALGRPGALAELLGTEAAALAPAAAAEKHIEAADLWWRARDVERTAAALVMALPHQPQQAADLLARALAGADAAELPGAVGARVADTPVAPLHALAGRLGGIGRPLDAHAVLAARNERASLELRASFAEAAGDVALEITERTALVDSLPAGDAKAAALFRRLGALHGRTGGGGAAASADAYAHAAQLGAADVSAWLEAALASADGARLAEVLRREDVEVGQVPSGPLRSALGALAAPADAAVRLRLSAALAARAESIGDVEAYLAEARSLPPTRAAQVLAQAGERHNRTEWLLEGAALLDTIGDRAGAYAVLANAGGAVGADPAVREQAFNIALAGDDVPEAARAAARVLELEGLSEKDRGAVHARLLSRTLETAPERAADVAAAWLDDEPGSERALAVLVPARLKSKDTKSAVARLDDACRTSTPRPAVLALLEQAAEASHKHGAVDDEIRARELLVGASIPDEQRALELERLADLYAEADRSESAVDVLEARVRIGGSDAALAELFSRIAHLEEHQLKRPARAADALRGRLQHAPDDAASSRRLQALLEASGDHAGLYAECLRRADKLKSGGERTELWLKAGEAALRADRPHDAITAWLRALRATPYSKDALQRLLDLGRSTRNRRLAVRARVVAAQTLKEGPAAAEVAAEAGAYLAGVMNRPRLALLCFRFAERTDKKPARHTRVIVDLLRALGDAPGALAALDRLLDRAKDKAKEKDRALLLETRADVLEQLMQEPGLAAEARRAALVIEPAQKTSARSLARHLRGTGDLRGALDVDRAYAEAALAGPALAAAYQQLAALADEEIADAALAAELCARSLKLRPSLDVRRRQARLLESLGRTPEAVDVLAEMLAPAAVAEIELDERLALIAKKARLEREELGRREEARRTLRAALEDSAVAEHPAADKLIDELARAEEDLDEPGAAAALLLDVLAEREQGTPALGSRTVLLERIGGLLDDARDPQRAFDLLEQAAGLEGLTRAGELRRARLAEELERHGSALASLNRLLTLGPDAEQRVALLGRLAGAAERASQPESALAAWQERAQRMPGDADTLRAIERLAGLLGRAGDARTAGEALARLDVGDPGERRDRLIALARDSRDRLDDAAAAVSLLLAARAVQSDPALRRELLDCAERASDVLVALDALDEMGVAELSATDLLRRAALRQATAGDVERVLDDVVAAHLAGAEPDGSAPILRALLDAAPAPVWQRVMALAGVRGPAFLALRGVLASERVTDPRIPLALLLAAADGLPDDGPIVREAAARERADGHTLRAADRLTQLSVALSEQPAARAEADDALDAAAEALLDGAGASAVLARLEAVRPALMRRAALRSRALVVLRDAEAWEAVAQLLEDALETLTGAEQRAARLELVSVLRTGVGSEERAAPHLMALVDADPDDREAWGELFECLDALGDKDSLAEALGRRARRASGIERRELVRRRATLLVERQRGAEVLDELVQVRGEAPGDAELFELERRVHAQRGPSELAAFLYAELMRNPDAAVAAALLELPAAAAGRDARAKALVVLCERDAKNAESCGARALEPGQLHDGLVDEIVDAATRLGGDARSGFLRGVAKAAGALGSRGALGLIDALKTAGIVEAPRAFGVATVARRRRVSGAAAAARDARELFGAATDDRSRRQAALAEVVLAARRSQPQPLLAAVAAAGLPDAAGAALRELAEGGAARLARATLEERAAHATDRAARTSRALAWSVRQGDERVSLAARSAVDVADVARLTRHGKLTARRLPQRLVLADHLEAGAAAASLAAIAQLARSSGKPDVALKALDGVIARGGETADLLVARADVAAEAGAFDAAEWAQRAAAALEGQADRRADVVRLLRRAVEHKLRGSATDLPDAVRALSRSAPEDSALQAEALGVAQAAGLFDLVDELMASAAEHSAGAEARAEAIRRRAEHRLNTKKDAAGAFRVLAGGAALGDKQLRDEAYALAAREGLVEEMSEVVDDDLARAALLALLGKRRQALEIGVRLDSPEGWLFVAEAALKDDDISSAGAALEKLVEAGAADPAARMLLVTLDARRNRLEDAARGAAELVTRFGASPERIALLLEVARGGAGAGHAAPVLRQLISDDLLSPVLLDRAVDVWEAAATVAGLPDDVRGARLRRCRLRDDDTLWLELLVVEVPKVGADEAALWLRPLLGRASILGELVAADVAGLAEALRVLVRAGDAAVVADALRRVEATSMLSWPLREALGVALEVQGDAAAAAEALARGAVPPAVRSRRAARAASLFLEAGDADRATDVLIAVPLDDIDDELLSAAREVAAAAAGGGAALAVRVATVTGDDADVDSALAAAELAPPDVAQAVAAWRLKVAPTDERAWQLVARAGAGAAQALFSTLLALRGLGPWPAALTDDAARLRRLRDGMLPAHVATAWVEAGRPRSAMDRARRGVPDVRKAAWRDLARGVASDEIAVARLLSRAGVPMSEAPIEVRLAADPALRDDRARAKAIATALSEPEISGSPPRAAALRDRLVSLDDKGFVTVAMRRAALGPREGLLGLVEAMDQGDRPTAAAVLAALGDKPEAASRTTAAALLSAAGHDAIALLVDARIEARSARGPSSEKLEERAQHAAERGAADEALGLLLLVTAMRGVDRHREQRIRELATQLSRYELVAQSLGRSAFGTEEKEQRARLLLERAELRARKLDDAHGAVIDARHAAGLTPDIAAGRAWLSAAEALGSAAEIGAALDALSARDLDPQERKDLQLRRVRLLLEVTGDAAGALKTIDEMLGQGARDARLLELQGGALRRLERHSEAAHAFSAAAEEAPADARPALKRQAASSFSAAGLFDLAVDALCAGTTDAELLAEAEALARDKAGPAALAQALEAQLAVSTDAHRRRLLSLERARVLCERLGERAQAIGILEAQALADAGDVGARVALAEWYEQDRRHLDAALAYESAAQIKEVPPAVSGSAAREAAALLASVGDLGRAGPLADQALASGIVDHKVLAVAEAWHRAEGRFDRVDALLDQEIALEPDPRKQAHLYLERYAVRRDWLNDAAAAKKMLQLALEIDPGHERALGALRSDAQRDGSWGALRAALFRAAEMAIERPRAATFLKEIAQLDLERFNDPRAAEASIDRALEVQPNDADALLFKARLMVRAGTVDGVPAILERAERAGARELPGILSVVRGDGLLISGDREGARRAFFEATKDKETASRAWDRLIDLADGTPQAVLVLEDARAASDDNKRKISLIRKEARLRQKGGDDDGYVRVLEELLALEPGDGEALKQVREAYTRKRKLQPLVPLLQGHANAAEGAERARRLGELGGFLLDEIGNEAQARAAFEEALAVDPSESRALLGLADVVWAARDDERALELLDRITPEQWPREQTELLYRRARCAYALGRDDAMQRLRAVLRVDSKHQDALQMLVQLATLKNDDDAAEFALEALTGAIPAREDPVRLAQACVDLAALRGRQGKFKEALVAAERAAELDPTKIEVLEAVAAAREQADKPLEAAEAWRRVAGIKQAAGRVEALERRVKSLITAGKIADAVSELIDLRRETGQGRFKDEAEQLARKSGDTALMKKVGILPDAPSPVTVEMAAHSPLVSGIGNAIPGPEAPADASGSAPPGPVAVTADFVPAAAVPTAAPRAEVTRTEASSPSASGSDRANQRGFNALHMQVRANIDENDPRTALRIVFDAVAAGQGDISLMRLGVQAAEQSGDVAPFLDLVDRYLKQATDPNDVKEMARSGGRLAREKLVDLDRAAALLYVAHQADAEDTDVRIELTELYAQIPRLSGHAVTGILQLLRRQPASERVFRLSASLADSQQQPERARNMRAVAEVLAGNGVDADGASKRALLDERPQIRPLDAGAIAARLAPSGWGGALQQLIAVLGTALDVALFGEAVVPADARPLHEATPRGALALDRMERLLPGRPFRAFVGRVDAVTLIPSAVPTVVLPADLNGLGDAALIAGVARAYGVVRIGSPLTELMRAGDEANLEGILRAAFADGPPHPRAEKLLSRLRDDEKQAARALAAQVFDKPVDVGATMGVLQRGADRFALAASGDVLATLHVSSLPTLLREPPQRARALLHGSTRALELAAFGARDNAWLVRRQQGLSAT